MTLDKRVVILGQGYVGLPLAIEASNYFKVFGYDVDAEKIALIKDGKSPIEDVTGEALGRALKSGNFQPTEDPSVISIADVVVICVPTPLSASGTPDVNALTQAVHLIKQHISPKTLVISESTSYCGTLRWIESEFRSLSFFNTLNFAVAPERVNPSDLLWKMRNTPRIVGAIGNEGLARSISFYRLFCDQVFPVDSPEIAELAKLFENTFRLVNIGLVNELNQLVSKLGVDFRKVIDAASTKPYGFMPFQPGPGVGGHCIPIDPLYLQYSLEQIGQKSTFIEIAVQQNSKAKDYVCERIHEVLNRGKVLLVGVAYKKNISDTRESPAEDISTLLSNKGYKVLWTDSMVESWSHGERWNESDEVDLAVVLVAHTSENFEIIKSKSRNVIDVTGSLLLE